MALWNDLPCDLLYRWPVFLVPSVEDPDARFACFSIFERSWVGLDPEPELGLLSLSGLVLGVECTFWPEDMVVA